MTAALPEPERMYDSSRSADDPKHKIWKKKYNYYLLCSSKVNQISTRGTDGSDILKDK